MEEWGGLKFVRHSVFHACKPKVSPFGDDRSLKLTQRQYFITVISKEWLTSQNIRSIFTTSTTSHVLLEIFMQFVAVEAKIWWNNKGSSFFWNTVYILIAISKNSIFVSLAIHNDNRILQRTAQNKWSWREMKKLLSMDSVTLCRATSLCYVMLCCVILYIVALLTVVFDCSHFFMYM